MAANPELSCAAGEFDFDVELGRTDTAVPSQWEIYEGDALTELDRVADGSCKLVVTSPPYNIGKEYERDKRLSLDEYISFCARSIAHFLKAVRENVSDSRWTTDRKTKDRVITVTYVNAFLITMRKLIEDGKSLDPSGLKGKLAGISQFKFDEFHSSQYNRMAEKIYEKYFA